MPEQWRPAAALQLLDPDVPPVHLDVTSINPTGLFHIPVVKNNRDMVLAFLHVEFHHVVALIGCHSHCLPGAFRCILADYATPICDE